MSDEQPDELNPYAFTGSSDGPASPSRALDDIEAGAARKLARWLLIAGGAQIVTLAILLMKADTLELIDWATTALYGVVPAVTVYAGFAMRALAGPKDLGEVSAGFGWLRLAFVLKGVAILAVIGLTAYALWPAFQMFVLDKPPI